MFKTYKTDKKLASEQTMFNARKTRLPLLFGPLHGEQS
jgi:hypothetical protein